MAMRVRGRNRIASTVLNASAQAITRAINVRVARYAERNGDIRNRSSTTGIVASGNQVVKDSVVRDRLGEEFEAKCVEMEAAGLIDDFPCLVIRGVCDYADTHKNDIWHRYAAATAAAYAKEFLSIIPPNAVSEASYASNVTVSLPRVFP